MTQTVKVALSAALAILRIGDYRFVLFFVKAKNIHGAYFITISAPDAFVKIVSLNHIFLSPFS
jgi:hypothetical protein